MAGRGDFSGPWGSEDELASDDAPVRSSATGPGSSARLNLTRLRYFVAVAEELHFGRAARRLGISQPPLSLHIKALEEQVGAELFSRVNRRVLLTAPGRLLYRQAARLLDHAQRVEYAMQGVGAGDLGELFVGCVPSAMYDVLPNIMVRYRSLHPKVHLVIKEGHTMDVMDGVIDGRLDVGLLWGHVVDPALGVLPILREQFCAVVPAQHKLSSKSAVSLSDLAREPLILPPRKISPYHHDHIVSAFVKQGLSPRIEHEVPTILSQIGFVASGFGVSIVPAFAKRFTTDAVAVVPIAEEMPPVVLTLAWSRERDSPANLHLRETAQQLYPNPNWPSSAGG